LTALAPQHLVTVRTGAAQAECARLREELGRMQYAYDQAVENGRLGAAAHQASQRDLESAEAECARLRQERGQLERRVCASENYATGLCNQIVAEQRAHRAARRAWATWLLENGFGEQDWTPDVPRWFTDIPEPVAALVRKHANDPVGTCDRCGKTAPLVNSLAAVVGKALEDFPAAGDMVCAWGCEPAVSQADAPREGRP
jgi:hypothetical protein